MLFPMLIWLTQKLFVIVIIVLIALDFFGAFRLKTLQNFPLLFSPTFRGIAFPVSFFPCQFPRLTFTPLQH